MDINSFPTDSLWKFMAITGLVLLVFNAYYNVEMKYQLSLETVDITYKQNKLKEKYKALKVEHDTLNVKYQSILKKTREEKNLMIQHRDKYRSIIHKVEAKKEFTKQDQHQTDSLKKAYPNIIIDEETYLASEKEASKISEELELKGKKLSEELDLLELEEAKLSLKNSKMNFYFYSLLIGTILGTFFMVTGFSKWYVLQQASDDRIIKKEKPSSNSD